MTWQCRTKPHKNTERKVPKENEEHYLDTTNNSKLTLFYSVEEIPSAKIKTRLDLLELGLQVLWHSWL